MRETPRQRYFVRVAGLLAAACVSAASGQDWSGFRGSSQRGAAELDGRLMGQTRGLELVWKMPLGSGYSSIVAAGETGLTMFADGEDDLLVAFDTGTGEEGWRYRIAPMHAGHSGSDDGPSSTPTVHDGVAYGLGPAGHLFAVRLSDGSAIWARRLPGAEASSPHYGFASSPLVAGDLLIVQAGGPDERALSAFDLRSGETRWTLEGSPLSYQSPALAQIHGRELLVTVDDLVLRGIDPATGTLLWQHRHGTLAEEAFTQPQAVGANRILINSLQEVVLFEIASRDGTFAVEEVWRSTELKSSYAIPVIYEGYVYGFNGRFLTCLDAADGRVMWKSRPPGGRSLIRVGDTLAVMDREGHLVLVKASPDGYEEVSRVAVLGEGGYTAPSFAGGLFFVRNLTEIAAVRLTETPVMAAASETEGRELLGDFGAFVRKVESAADTQELVDRFLAAQESFPIIEKGGLVHFVFRGAVDDVALRGNFLPWEAEVPMDSIAGTDVYFKSVRVDPEAHWWYRFNVNYGELIVDPLNPFQLGAYREPGSELRMPGWRHPAHVEASAGDRGRIESIGFRSEILADERRVRIWLPPGYDESSDRRYPVILIHDADPALEQARFDHTLDNLVGETVAPLIAVFLPTHFKEVSGTGARDYLRMLVEELVPYLDRTYRTIPERESRAIAGVLYSGAFGVFAALESQAFGKVATQSTLLQVAYADELWPRLWQYGVPRIDAYVAWGRHDVTTGNGKLDAARDSQRLAHVLRAHWHRVLGGETAGSWGWGTWRSQFDDILQQFFPMHEPVQGLRALGYLSFQ